MDAVAEVARLRDTGLSLEVAVQRAAAAARASERSIFSAVSRLHPSLTAHALRKRALIALSSAIEDECLARAERAFLFGSFQRERHYRAAEPRWRELARTAEAAVVFADFGRLSQSTGRPAEVPLERDAPLAREWSLVCDAPGYAALLCGWEVPSQSSVADSSRCFETVWSVDPRVVRHAARAAVTLAAEAAPALADRLARRLEDDPPPAGERQVALLSDLAGRMVAYLANGEPGRSGRPATRS